MKEGHMGRTIEGTLIAKGLRLGIVVSRFNSIITERLVAGALDAITRNGGSLDNVDVVKVPGAFELPLVAKQLALSKKYDAIICLGAIIKGDTPHFEFISNETAKGIASVMLESGTPLSFGVITAENLEQAIVRAGAKSGNKGEEAAQSAIEMANLLKNLRAER